MGLVEGFIEWFNHLSGLVLNSVDSPWALLVIAAFCLIDGLIPAFPSESVIIAVAAISVAGQGPPLWLLILVAAGGAWLGDNLVFSLGRLIPVERIPFLNRGRGLELVTKANATIHKRPAPLLIAARFIPGGRVAVNVSAGAMGFSRRRFMQIDAFAVLLWASYSALLGLAAGAYLHDHPLIAAMVGVTLGVLFGVIVDRLFAWWQRRRARRAAAEGVVEGPAEGAMEDPAEGAVEDPA